MCVLSVCARVWNGRQVGNVRVCTYVGYSGCYKVMV